MTVIKYTLSITFYLLTFSLFSQVRISEVFFNPIGTDDGLEWVELYNDSDTRYYLTDHTITLGQDGAYPHFPLPSGAFIEPYAYYLIGGPISNANNFNPCFDWEFNFAPNLDNQDCSNCGYAAAVTLFDNTPAEIGAGAGVTPIHAVFYNGSFGHVHHPLVDENGNDDVHITGVGEGVSLVWANNTWNIETNPTPTGACNNCNDPNAHNYQQPGTCETCFDGIQNGDEAGVDCGGTNPDCPSCGCGGGTQIGDPCDDNDLSTINDVYDENCDCVGVDPCTAYPIGGTKIVSNHGETIPVNNGRYIAFAVSINFDIPDYLALGLFDTENPNAGIQYIRQNGQEKQSISIDDNFVVWRELTSSNDEIWYYDLNTQTSTLVANNIIGGVHGQGNIIAWRATNDELRYYDIQNPILNGTVVTSYPGTERIGNIITNGRYIIWEQIYITGGNPNNKTIHLYDLQNINQGVVDITSTLSEIGSLNITGDLILWRVGSNNGAEVYLYDLQNTNAGVQRLTNNSVLDGYASSDGRYIVWGRDYRVFPYVAELILYDTQNPGETVIATHSVIRKTKIQNGYIVWEGWDTDGPGGINVYNLNNPSLGELFLSYDYPDERLEFVDDIVCWDDDNDIYYYQLVPIEDNDMDGFCAPYDCDDNNSNIYPGAPCEDEDICTVSILNSDCNCITIDYAASNDICANAASVSVNGSIEACNDDATDSSLTPTCGVGQYGGDTWFSFTLSGGYTADVQIGVNYSDFDRTFIEVFSGECGQLTSIACNDEFTFFGSPEIIALSDLPSDETYYFRVWDNNNNQTGTFEVYLDADYFTPCYGVPLQALYDATNGDDWTNNSGWLQGCDPCSWQGITCDGNGNITNIILPGNNLTGTLPKQIGELSSLQVLNLNSNQIGGSIPPELGNATALKFSLSLNNNNLIGHIPPELGNLNQLLLLGLDNNELEGTLPDALSNIPLSVLSVKNNNLEGCYPDSYDVFCAKTTDFTGNNLPIFDNFCNGDYPPANDFCNIEATQIPLNGSVTTYNTCATQSINPLNPICHAANFYEGGDIWFEFTTFDCAGTTDVEIKTIAPDLDWLHIVVLDACDGAIVSCGIAETLNQTTEVSINTIPNLPCNTTYKMQVYDRGNDQFGNIQMFVNCVSNCIALPLALVNFSGKSLTHANQLQWTTATEQDLAYFQVERSKDGQTDWEVLNKIHSKGDSNTSQSYETLDDQPLQKAFYRLQIVEQSGKAEVSEMIFVQRELQEIDWQIIPNPAQYQFSLQFDLPKSMSASIMVHNILGQVVFEKTYTLEEDHPSLAFDSSQWSEGIYLISINMEGSVMTKKLIIKN